MIRIIGEHYVSIFTVLRWLLKILFLYVGFGVLTRHLVTMYLKFIQVFPYSMKHEAWKLEFTVGWIRLTALSLVLIILGIII